MSDVMRLTGLTSGLDTDSMITAMVSGHKTKVDEAKQDQTMLEWTQTAWKDMNSKIYGLYSGKNGAKVRISSPGAVTSRNACASAPAAPLAIKMSSIV